ncbi:MAG: hypothetical protein ACR2RL_09920, partial [Gammaproteobacteria bacterium]
MTQVPVRAMTARSSVRATCVSGLRQFVSRLADSGKSGAPGRPAALARAGRVAFVLKTYPKLS